MLQAQTSRRVKWYLANVKVVTDESVLHQISLAIEATPNGHAHQQAEKVNKAKSEKSPYALQPRSRVENEIYFSK